MQAATNMENWYIVVKIVVSVVELRGVHIPS